MATQTTPIQAKKSIQKGRPPKVDYSKQPKSLLEAINNLLPDDEQVQNAIAKQKCEVKLCMPGENSVTDFLAKDAFLTEKIILLHKAGEIGFKKLLAHSTPEEKAFLENFKNMAREDFLAVLSELEKRHFETEKRLNK